MSETHIPDADLGTIQDWVAKENSDIPEDVRPLLRVEVGLSRPGATAAL